MGTATAHSWVRHRAATYCAVVWLPALISRRAWALWYQVATRVGRQSAQLVARQEAVVGHVASDDDSEGPIPVRFADRPSKDGATHEKKCSYSATDPQLFYTYVNERDHVYIRSPAPLRRTKQTTNVFDCTGMVSACSGIVYLPFLYLRNLAELPRASSDAFGH